MKADLSVYRKLFYEADLIVYRKLFYVNGSDCIQDIALCRGRSDSNWDTVLRRRICMQMRPRTSFGYSVMKITGNSAVYTACMQPYENNGEDA